MSGEILKIRKKITATEKIGRLTRAMQLVSSSRFYQCYDKTKKSRPFVETVKTLLGSMGQDVVYRLDHPFLKNHDHHPQGGSGAVGAIVFGTQKGLCGGLNHQLLREVVKDLGHQQVAYWVRGEKVRGLMDGLKMPYLSFADANLDHADFFITLFQAIDQYRKGHIKELYLCYNRYDSLVEQTAVCEKLLPIDAERLFFEQPQEEKVVKSVPLYEIEPDIAQVFDWLITEYCRSLYYQAGLESLASEHASRMVAMKSATDNAKKVVDTSLLKYNKARQAMITSEIIEIVSGAEAV